MDTTEFTAFMFPNSNELQQLSEPYKAMAINPYAELTSDGSVSNLAKIQANESIVSRQLCALRIVRLACSHKIVKNMAYSLQDEQSDGF